MNIRNSDGYIFMVPKEAAEFTGVASERTFLRWAREGKVADVRLPNGRVLFRQSDLEELITPIPATADSPDSDVLFDRDWQAEG